MREGLALFDDARERRGKHSRRHSYPVQAGPSGNPLKRTLRKNPKDLSEAGDGGANRPSSLAAGPCSLRKHRVVAAVRPEALLPRERLHESVASLQRETRRQKLASVLRPRRRLKPGGRWRRIPRVPEWRQFSGLSDCRPRANSSLSVVEAACVPKGSGGEPHSLPSSARRQDLGRRDLRL